MTDSMVERVAKVLSDYCAAADQGVFEPTKAARAAIAAMREPTEAMWERGYAAACEHDYGETPPDHEIANATYRAMIDAALKES